MCVNINKKKVTGDDCTLHSNKKGDGLAVDSTQAPNILNRDSRLSNFIIVIHLCKDSA